MARHEGNDVSQETTRRPGGTSPSDEISAGDAQDSRQDWIEPDTYDPPNTEDPEVPEADAIEQAQPWVDRSGEVDAPDDEATRARALDTLDPGTL